MSTYQKVSLLPHRSGFAYRSAVVAMAVMAVTGCSIVPHDGPSRSQVERGAGHATQSPGRQAEGVNNAMPASPYTLVTLDQATAETIGQYYRDQSMQPPPELQPPRAADEVGPGDKLQIYLWEAGQGGLFSSPADRTDLGVSQGAQRTLDFPTYVDRNGNISVPYVGRVHVAGQTTADIEATIVGRLRGRSAQPQVSVQIADNIANTVMVEGYVNKPGRYPIVSKGARLLDLVATTGGFTSAPEEITLRLTRGDQSVDVPAAEATANRDMNLMVSPGDTLMALHAPMHFYAFGAVGQAGQQVFDRAHPSLLDALGKVSSITDERADARGVFVFRQEPAELRRKLRGKGGASADNAEQPTPVVYQLNMRDPNSFFVLKTFPVQPSDVIYVANAPLVEFGKFVRIITGLTSSVSGPVILSR